MFTKPVQDEIVRMANANRIDPARLLAVVEIESDGKAVEPADGITPQLLFERHIFYRELTKRAPDKLQSAISAGLAIPKWNRATQYSDQGTSAKRLALFARAKAVDEECATRSCSWGVGQTMGFLAEELGFINATDMLRKMIAGGVPAQVDCMVREIKRKKLDVALAARDWKKFAYGYNGAGYAANKYDIKLAAACEKWEAALDPHNPETGAVPVEIPITRQQETKPMTQSTIGNAANVTVGLTATSIIAMVIEELGKLPDKALDVVLALAQKPPFWIALAVGGIAFYIWKRRQTLKQETGV